MTPEMPTSFLSSLAHLAHVHQGAAHKSCVLMAWPEPQQGHAELYPALLLLLLVFQAVSKISRG